MPRAAAKKPTENNVVKMSTRRPVGLVCNEVWVEKAHPEDQWVITAINTDDSGTRHISISPFDDPDSEAVYAESYFRKHFLIRVEWVRRENRRRQRAALRKKATEVFDAMVVINNPKTLKS